MTNFKGTKGKWTKYSASLMGSDKKASYSVYIGTKRVALCYDLFEYDKSKNVDESEAQANALLISKAPELLVALTDILKWSAHFPQAMNEELQNAKLVIKQATEL